MDYPERRVLMRKKCLITESLVVDIPYLSCLKREAVIDDKSEMCILEQKNNPARVHRLVEVLIRSCSETVMEGFINSLMTFDLMWLAKDIKTELKIEQGILEIDEDVMVEARMIVHRKFGISKRLSEGDKKLIADVLACRIQTSKDEWREEVEFLRKQVQQQKEEYNVREDRLLSLINLTQKYLKDNETSLMTLSHGMRSTSQVLKEASCDTDIIGMYRFIMKDLMNRVSRIVKERDLFHEERLSVINILGLKEDIKSLSQAVKCMVASYPVKLEKAHFAKITLDRQLTEKNTLIQKLTQQVRDQSLIIQELTDELQMLKPERGVPTITEYSSSPTQLPCLDLKKKSPLPGCRSPRVIQRHSPNRDKYTK